MAKASADHEFGAAAARRSHRGGSYRPYDQGRTPKFMIYFVDNFRHEARLSTQQCKLVTKSKTLQ